jgi:hypothetical protein
LVDCCVPPPLPLFPPPFPAPAIVTAGCRRHWQRWQLCQPEYYISKVML